MHPCIRQILAQFLPEPGGARALNFGANIAAVAVPGVCSAKVGIGNYS